MVPAQMVPWVYHWPLGMSVNTGEYAVGGSPAKRWSTVVIIPRCMVPAGRNRVSLTPWNSPFSTTKRTSS